MSTKRYTALTPIEHDGQRVEEGGKLDLTEEQAAPLLALKAVELARQRAAKPAAGEPADAGGDAAADAAADAAGATAAAT